MSNWNPGMIAAYGAAPIPKSPRDDVKTVDELTKLEGVLDMHQQRTRRITNHPPNVDTWIRSLPYHLRHAVLSIRELAESGDTEALEAIRWHLAKWESRDSE